MQGKSMISPHVDPPVRFWFVRHGRMESHHGDRPLTEEGRAQAEGAGERLAAQLPGGARVEFASSPPLRAQETAAGIRRGLERTLDPGAGVVLGEPRVEPAIRNGDLWLAGHRVELVASPETLLEQLPGGLMTIEQLQRNRFMTGFWSAPDPMGYWLEHPDPPGERSVDVAHRFVAYARSMLDVDGDTPRAFVCATHSGVLRSLVTHRMGVDDPGEPGYVESVALTLAADGTATWSFRDAVVTKRA
jgi:broad specificity phosphatase PhoE